MDSYALVVEPYSRVDLTPAEQYGKLTYLYKKPRGDKLTSSDILLRAERLEFDPALDYFLAAGNVVTVALAINALAGEYGPLRLLLWDQTQKRYLVRERDLS